MTWPPAPASESIWAGKPDHRSAESRSMNPSFSISHTTLSSMTSSTVSLLAGVGGARLLHLDFMPSRVTQGTLSRIFAMVR